MLSSAAFDAQVFAKLQTVWRKLEGAAHFPAARALFLRDQPVAVPFRGDLLVTIVFGFLQLAPVGHERALAVAIVHQVHFRAGHRERHGRRRAQKFVHFLPFLIALLSAHAAAMSSVSSTSWPASSPASGGWEAGDVLCGRGLRVLQACWGLATSQSPSKPAKPVIAVSKIVRPTFIGSPEWRLTRNSDSLLSDKWFPLDWPLQDFPSTSASSVTRGRSASAPNSRNCRARAPSRCPSRPRIARNGTPAARAASASSMLSPTYNAVLGSRAPRMICRPSGCGFFRASSMVMMVRKYFVAGQRSNVKENSCRVRPVNRFSSKRSDHFSICRGLTSIFSLRTFPGFPSLPQ